MATKKRPMLDSFIHNENQGKSPNLNIKKSFTDDEQINNNVDENHISQKSNDINKTNIDNTTTTSTPDSISFKSYINNAYKLDSDEIKYEIDVIVLNAVNSVQFKYDRNEEGKTIRVNYFDDKTNSRLLKDVFIEVRDLVQSLDNITVDEKNDYFSRIVDDFLRQRLKFIIKIGLDNMFTPKEIEHSMDIFMSSGKDFFDNYSEISNEYLGYYKSLALFLVEARVDRCTFYINELNQEAIKLIKKDKALDISAYINELITNSFDSSYIEKARKNIYDRKPFNTMITKTHKKLMKQHDLI